MIEVTGNLWTYPADWRCITTNGFVKKNGECVMGRGCAREYALKHPEFPKRLGDALKDWGNVVRAWHNEKIVTFPVKHNWYEKADPELIRRSAVSLAILAEKYHNETFLLPRPGCGNGQLSWADVKPLLIDLPDNVKVITFDDSKTD